MKNDFGDQISIEYIDVQDSDRLQDFPHIGVLLETTSLSMLPVILFNGNPVWYGSIEYSQLVGEISKQGKAS